MSQTIVATGRKHLMFGSFVDVNKFGVLNSWYETSQAAGATKAAKEIPCADEELSTGDGFIQAHPGEESCVDFNIKQMLDQKTPRSLLLLAQETTGPFLALVFKAALEHLNLSTKLKLSQQKVALLMRLLQHSYLSNRYHHDLHAADVLMKVLMMLCKEKGWLSRLSPAQLLALLLAAAGHDSGHTGLTNGALKQMGWKKETANGTCFTYEQFHLANILSWLDQTGLLSTMSITDAAEVRHIIEVCILATDMQGHDSLLDRVRELCQTFGNNVTAWPKACQAVALALLLHYGDISNPLLPFEQSAVWAAWVSREIAFAKGVTKAAQVFAKATAAATTTAQEAAQAEAEAVLAAGTDAAAGAAAKAAAARAAADAAALAAEAADAALSAALKQHAELRGQYSWQQQLKTEGLTVSDGEKSEVAANQMGFMARFVKPCLDVFSLIAPTVAAEDMKLFEANMKRWQEFVQPSKVAAAPAAATSTSY